MFTTWFVQLLLVHINPGSAPPYVALLLYLQQFSTYLQNNKQIKNRTNLASDLNSFTMAGLGGMPLLPPPGPSIPLHNPIHPLFHSSRLTLRPDTLGGVTKGVSDTAKGVTDTAGQTVSGRRRDRRRRCQPGFRHRRGRCRQGARYCWGCYWWRQRWRTERAESFGIELLSS